MTTLYTPRDWWNKLNSEFHFEVDLAASEEHHLCDEYYTIENNAFKHAWSKTSWCSPPWAETHLWYWVNKAYEDSQKYGNQIVMLLPIRQTAIWWQGLILKGVRIRFLQEPIKFFRADGTRNDVVVEPHCLVIFGGKGYKMAELSFRDIEWRIEEALLEMFPSAQVEVYVDPEPPAPYIVAIYSDYVIIETWDGEGWEYWKVSYSINGETVLAPRSEWEETESRSEWVTKDRDERLAKAQKSRKEIEFDIAAPCGKKTIKILDKDTRRIGAYATIWGELDCDGERMTRKALEPSFERIKAKEAIPWMFWKHGVDPKFGSVIVGSWDPDSFVMDDLGLYVEGNLGTNDSGTKAMETLVDAGSVGLSVGTMWYLVKREKALDGTINLIDWPLVDISIMEGGKQCVPSAMREFHSKVLKGLIEDVVVKLGFETEQQEEKSSLLQTIARRIS